MKITALTILFGAIPATYLSWWALLGVYIGVIGVVNGTFLSGAVFIIWGAAGLYGTLSLWLIAFNRPSNFVVMGLFLGSVAILPISVSVYSSPISSDGWFSIPFVIGGISPFIVAAF